MLRARAAPHRLRRLLRHALPQAALRGAGPADGGRLLLLRRRARALLEPQDPARPRGRLPPRRAAPLPRRRTKRSCPAWRPGAPSAPLRRRRQVAQRQADAAARLRRQPRTRPAVRAVDRDVAPPSHRLSPRHATAHPARLSRRRSDRGLRRARRALPRRRRPTSTRARSSWPARRSSPSASPPCSPARNGEAEVLFIGQFEERKGLADLLGAFAALGDVRARLRLVGNGSLEPEVAASRGAGPAPGRRRLSAPGAPSRGARPRPVPRAALDHHRARPRAVGARRQRGDARRRARSSPPTPWARRPAAWSATSRNGLIVPERDPAALARGDPPARQPTPRWRLGSAIRRAATSSASATARWRTPSRPRSSTRSARSGPATGRTSG